MNKQEIEKDIEILKYYEAQPYFFEKDIPALDAFRHAISCMEQQLTNGWIPAINDDEHYPESFQKVQFTDGEDIFIGYCDPNYEWSSTDGENTINIDVVTAWQPLLSPYKEATHEA